MANLSTVASSNLDFQNFFSAKLSTGISASDTDIPMDAIPSISEGVLVIDWDVAASREVIFFNSKTASKVVCPSVANGRGFDSSTAVSHLSGANVIMAPVADYFRYIKYIATTSTAAWKPLGYTPNTITDNGNRKYTLVFNSVDLTSFISKNMRLKSVRQTNAPTQCTTLNGTTQYFNKATPAGLTVTNNLAAGAWIKPTALPAVTAGIITRSTAASGWQLRLQANGQIVFVYYNAGITNFTYVMSNAIITTNRWQHVAGQHDAVTFTNTPTTSYIMIDGVDVLAPVVRSGSNPTACVQTGDLEIGVDRTGGGAFFTGKIAQAWVATAKITQDNVRLIKNQGLTAANCTTYNIASAFSLSGASGATDINTTNANNLTANASAATTTDDSPFTQNDQGTPSGDTDYAVVLTKAFSTNTTLTVQVPEGCSLPTLPTSSAISTMYYSTEFAPFGMPDPQKLWVNIQDATITDRTVYDQNRISSIGNQMYYNPTGMTLSREMGLLIQVGSLVYTSTVGVGTPMFSQPFPNGVMTVVATFGDTTQGNSSCVVSAPSRTGFTVTLNSAFTGAVRLNYIAFGF